MCQHLIPGMVNVALLSLWEAPIGGYDCTKPINKVCINANQKTFLFILSLFLILPSNIANTGSGPIILMTKSL